MIKIAHRGNYKGVNKDLENSPDYILDAIAAGYNVEVDAWLIEDKWMLGHDFPTHEVDRSFLERPEIWTHAKNLVGYVSLYSNPKAHTFWHDKDEYTFTSKGIKWANIDVPTLDGVMVLPDKGIWLKEMLLKKRIGLPLGMCCDSFEWMASLE